MSHGHVLVVVDVVHPKDSAEIEAAVYFQMVPYWERKQYFRDGSRFDYYYLLDTPFLAKDFADTPTNAFVRARHWHESSRMGCCGFPALTECEYRHRHIPDVLTRRCLTVGDDGARICTWNEPWEIWKVEFAKRFIEPLPPETVIVPVGYHV